MGKLQVGTFVTVDGVMQAPGGPDEDRDGGFEHGGWSFHYWDDAMESGSPSRRCARTRSSWGGGPTRSSRSTGRTSATTTPSRPS